MNGPSAPGYESLGLVGNCTSAALISSDSTVQWLCLPFFDSPSVFASLLDHERGGFFKVEAGPGAEFRQAYLPETAVLCTRVRAPDGEFELIDFMPRFREKSGRIYCPPELHRLLRRVSGAPRIRVLLEARPNYGASGVELRRHDEFIKLVSTGGEYNSYYLYTDLDPAVIIERREFDCPERAFMVFAYHDKLSPVAYYEAELDRKRTMLYWQNWSLRTRFPEARQELALRSTITLKLLAFERTGALIAAPTTSLPEIVGGERNWDYRYCWVRDSAMIIDLFSRIGHAGTADGYMRFILDRMLIKNAQFSIMYGINGELDVPERILSHLRGYAGSAPVRVGNEAFRQVQTDIYGELVETIYTFLRNDSEQGGIFRDEIWTLTRGIVEIVRRIWQEPDAGIWERRGARKHHVHSKLMCWVAADRARRIAGLFGRPRQAADYGELAGRIRAELLERGWNERLGAFSSAYGSSELDASILLLLHYGLLEAADPRMKRTVDLIRSELTCNDFTFRYTDPDDFGRPANAFLICSFWMVNALHLTGRREEAQAMFDRLAARATPLGLLSEDIEPDSGRLTGNFPQGYSHLALLQSLLLLETDYAWSDEPAPAARHMRRRREDVDLRDPEL